MDNMVVYKFGGSSLATDEKLRRAAEMLLRAKQEGKQPVAVVSAQADETDDLLAAASRLSEKPNARELDALLATGEQKSAALLALVLHEMGTPACSLSAPQAGILCSEVHGAARITAVHAGRIRQELASGSIPVVTGFQGLSAKGDLCTLGRGGSDASACALAAALDCPCIICTDVDGVFTADPRIIPDAHRIPDISGEEMLELASAGAGVLMDRSAQLALKYALNLQVRSCEPQSEGTVVHGSINESPSFQGAALLGGLSLLTGCVKPHQLSQAAELFSSLRGSCFWMMPNGGEATVGFLLPQSEQQEAIRLCGEQNLTLQIQSGVARVSVVGSGAMSAQSVPMLLETLRQADIPVYAAGQSASCVFSVVEERQQNLALQLLHERFLRKS